VGPASKSPQIASREGYRSEPHSIKPGTDDVEQSAPVSFHPPAPSAGPPKLTTTKTIYSHARNSRTKRVERVEIPFCARSPKRTRTKITVHISPRTLRDMVNSDRDLEGTGSRQHSIASEVDRKDIVVGIRAKEESVLQEKILFVVVQEDLFKQIRYAERQLRHPLRRLLSLKRVGAFGLYRCHPLQDYHSHPDISDETKRCLAELYRSYRTEKRDYQDRWMTWIHANFNNGSNNPKDGTYTLQLLLQWSPIKLIIWSLVPILLSLAIGLWYMINPYPGEDHVVVVQTAWTIASYIVTTAAREQNMVYSYAMCKR